MDTVFTFAFYFISLRSVFFPHVHRPKNIRDRGGNGPCAEKQGDFVSSGIAKGQVGQIETGTHYSEVGRRKSRGRWVVWIYVDGLMD